MPPVSILRVVFGTCALTVAAGGAWVGILNSGANNPTVTSHGDELVTGLPTPAPNLASTPEAPPQAASVTSTAAPPTPVSPPTPGTSPSTEAVSGPLPTITATPPPRPVPPTAAPIADLPAMTANEVLALSRHVRLPSGMTFEACGAAGPEGEPWPLSVHLYYTGHGGWVVATHREDAALLFDESTRTFRVDAITRPGC